MCFVRIIFRGKGENVQNPRNIIPTKINPIKVEIILEKYLCRKLFLVKMYPSNAERYERKLVTGIFSLRKLLKSNSPAFGNFQGFVQLPFQNNP